QMYIEGVSTRKVRKITMKLCGHEFSASTVSRMTSRLDSELDKFARRLLEEEFPYLILDARYEKVRIDGVIRSMAVLIAIGVGWDGRRQVLGIEVASRESTSHWKDMLLKLKERGLSGVKYVVSDDHPGLKKSIAEVLPDEASCLRLIRALVVELHKKWFDEPRYLNMELVKHNF
ncbi:MAG: transposase, partial [Candidatus Nanoarchaeia archaeon]